MPGGRDFQTMGTYEEKGMKRIQEHLTSAWKTCESDTGTDTARRETEDETKEVSLAATVAPETEVKPLVLLQVNSRNIYLGT
jgi:hypothetical protein